MPTQDRISCFVADTNSDLFAVLVNGDVQCFEVFLRITSEHQESLPSFASNAPIIESHPSSQDAR